MPPQFHHQLISTNIFLNNYFIMKIQEIDEKDQELIKKGTINLITNYYGNYNRKNNKEKMMMMVHIDAKRALVGAGARILFYPTLLYNVVRNKFQTEFRWWDQIDQEWVNIKYLSPYDMERVDLKIRMKKFLLLGAVPFPKDVPRLRNLGVGGVITLNEPYETLVQSSLYHAHGIDHLVIPTRDYLFAPSFVDISRAVDFIHKNASCDRTTYVHCKAGRGRSTTIVLCYLVQYKHMTPLSALEYVRSRRPRVLLAPAQWKAVQEYTQWRAVSSQPYQSGDAVLITKADLEGYHSPSDELSCKELAMVPRNRRQKPMISKLSCLFSSLLVSSSNGTIVRQLTDARAC